jgi:N-methylhydantoinase B/oxoprolinase/acetone carboxylase alpha subunit
MRERCSPTERPGGYGDTHERSPEAVREDILDEWISLESIRGKTTRS